MFKDHHSTLAVTTLAPTSGNYNVKLRLTSGAEVTAVLSPDDCGKVASVIQIQGTGMALDTIRITQVDPEDTVLIVVTHITLVGFALIP